MLRLRRFCELFLRLQRTALMAEIELDLSLRCDHLLTMKDGEVNLLRDQFVGVRGGEIVEISPLGRVVPHARKQIDARGQVVMPGLINGHTHLAMSLFKGLADDLPFTKWLFETILPLENKLLSPELVTTGVELAAMELIRAGVTTVCDMYYFADTVAEVLDRAGLRALIAEAVTDFPAPDEKVGGWRKIIPEMRERYAGHERIIAALGPHAPYTCSDEILKEMCRISDESGMQIVIHVAETRGEIEESLKKYGKTQLMQA
jgi:5-methylthioadenosine/S-adenosylhomocysteine deaminase